MKAYIATIDGPPASGKTTMAKLLAEKFNALHLDSGSIFRAITLNCMEQNVNLGDTEAIISTLSKVDIELSQSKVFLFGKDVSEKIRTPQVTNNIKFVSHIPEVRKFVKDYQIKKGNTHFVICDGRKVGTEVFPYAPVKFYLTADIKARALRRYKEESKKNPKTTYNSVYYALKSREEYEVQNNILLVPENAIIIDNTHLTIAETLKIMSRYMLIND